MGSIAIFGAKSFNEELHADECSIFSFWTFFGVLPKYVRVIFVEFSMPVFMDCFFHALFFFMVSVSGIPFQSTIFLVL